MSCALARCLLVLLATAAVAQGQQPPPACPLLDASGCCGGACRIGLCSALYSFGTALGAHNTTGIVWYQRQGWQQLYGISNSADAACDQLEATATAPAGATAPPQPFFCTWFGIQCRDTVFNSSCSTPAGSYGIFRIEIVNNNLSGNLSSKAFLAPLQLLHDCGLRQLVIGGGYGELRGELGPEWGRLSQLRWLSIFTTNLTGPLPPEIGKLTALEYLDLGGNYITGTLPDTLGNLRNLRILNLGKNGFTDIGKALQGPLPPSLTQLQRLEVLSLESNELSGTLPASLCRDMTALRAVSLKDNNFRGSITQMANCTLQSLDLSDNRFSGPLPVPLPEGPWGRPPWLHLMSISLANNLLTGELPEFPYGATPLLSIVSVAGNSITGSLPRSWTFLPWLSQVDVSYNRLSGTVPYELALQSMLTSLRLHSNVNITGTISPWFRLTVSLLTLTLHNTSVTGVLPGVSRSTFLSPGFNESRVCGGAGAGLGRLPALQLATVSDTQMTAVCSESESKCDNINDYLPWYLSTDPNAWEVPLPEPGFHDNSHMKCPRILAQEFCRLYRPPEPFADNMRPSWSVSPSYYHYKDCTCMGGYVASYITKAHGGVDIPVLVCSPAPTTLDPAEAAGVSVAASAVGMLLLAYCGYVSWYGRWGLPRLQRAVADLQKRREGAPTSGRVSIVVTDIESYSALMVAMPLAMGQALSQHSNVIRRAAWTHYGFIVGQEGDSFIIGFRDACDAVAFCLQVQQGLTKVPWPVELLLHQQQQDLAAAASVVQQLLEQAAPPAAAAPPLAVTTATAAAAAGGEYDSRSPAASSLQVSPTSSPFQSFRGSRGALCKTDSTTLEDILSIPAAADSHGQTAVQQDNLSNLLPRSSSSKVWQPRQQQQQQQQGLNGVHGSSPLTSQDGKLLPPPPPPPSPSAATAGVRLWRRPSSQDPSSPAVPTGAVSRDSGSFLRPLPSGVAAVAAAAAQIADSLRPMSPQQQQQQQVQEQQLLAPCSVLIPGLRVRMGVASGVLADGEDDCLQSTVLETARVVSDAGAGGQVLLCSTTFGLVKDRLEELGQVGSSGYVRSSRVTGWGAPKGWLARLARRHVQLAAEAVVLDMGMYSLPGVAVKPGTDHQRLLPELSAAASSAAAAAAVAAGKASTGDTAAAVAPVRLGQPGQQQQQATVAKTGAQTSSSTTIGCVRLYQILAPKCVERALLFGNNLALKRGARCHDLPYFCAPAAASRSLLDMLLVEGPPGHAPHKSSFSNAGAASRLWLRRKYRLPLAPSPVGPAALLSAHSDRRAATGSPRPWSSLSLHNGKTAGSSLLPIHQEGGRAQPASLYSKQAATPISLQTSLQDGTAASNCPSSPTAAADALATSAAATPTAEAAVVDSAHGSVWSAGTGSSAYPTVAIPLKGLAALWSSSGSDHAGTAASSGGITFVFASAMLPKWVRGDSGQLPARVSRMVGAVVRHTLLAFAAAAAAAADGSGAAGSVERHSSVAGGYLFRESTAEMKYLLSFHSPRAALEWCLLLQEALLWQDWPSILQNSRTAEASSHSLPAASAHQQQSAHQPAAAAGQEAVVNGQQAPPADLGAASSVLFSGPWVKMGVAAGAPQSVYPDYMGRADYHGNAVNMAARYEAVCAQPSQIVCDADLAASVMAEWAAAAAEAAAVESQLQQSAAVAAAAPASEAAAVAAQGTLTSAQQVSSSSSRQMLLSTAAVSALQQQQAQQDAAAAAVPRLPDTAQGAGDTASFEAELLLQQEPSLTGAADVAAVPAAVLQGRQVPQPPTTAADGSTAFTSFHQGRNMGLAQISLTSPFAAVAGSMRASPTAAANAAAVNVGIQAAPARNRPIPTRGKAARASNHRGVVGSAPAAPTGLSNSYSSSSRGSPPGRAAAMAAAAAAAAAAAEGRQGQRSSLDSRTGAPAAAAITKPHRRASSPGAAGDEAAATCSSISFSSGTGSGGGGGPAATTGNIPGLAGLGGGVGFYGAGCSRRLSSTLSYSASSSQQQQHQQQQQQQKSWTGRSVLRPTSPFAALAPPQLLPLQPPPVALPCPAAVPEGLPPFQVSVQTYRLGRYRFKGASAPIPMVEVAPSHLTPRRQHLQDPAALPKGPKGGIVEAEQGLVDDVTGVRLPGLAHLYRQQYQERLAAAAAASAAAAAASAGAAAASAAAAAGAAGGAGPERRAAFTMHRFLRNSLQQEQSTGKGSVSSASSAVAGPVGRLSSLLAQSFGAGGSNASVVRRASGMSTGSSRASRGASDGGSAGAAGGGGSAAAGGGGPVATE